MTDVCEHGRPDHQELIRQLLEALGMGTHARAVTPREMFERCLTEVRTLRGIVARLNDGWQYALPEGGGRQGRVEAPLPVEDPPPHRRLRLQLDLEADSLDDLTNRLYDILTRLITDKSETTRRISGAYTLDLTCDPEMNAERFASELEAWSQRSRARSTDTTSEDQ